MAIGEARPSGWLRRLLRAPIWLYRLHLGWLLGHRFLLLTHRGRQSGRTRQTVVEVVRYDPATQESVVVSGWRGETDWYRNIRAHPALLVQSGGDRYVPEQRCLDRAELIAEVRDAYARHPLELREFISRVFGLAIDGSERGFGEAADFFRGVALRPREPAHVVVGESCKTGQQGTECCDNETVRSIRYGHPVSVASPAGCVAQGWACWVPASSDTVTATRSAAATASWSGSA